MDTAKWLELAKDVDYVQTLNNGDVFRALTRPSILNINIRFVVTRARRKGLLPIILEDLLSA